MADQESATRTSVDPDHGQGSQSAGLGECRDCEVEQQVGALGSRVLDAYAFGANGMLASSIVCPASWQITMYLVKEDGKTPHERLFKRPYRGEVAEFGVCVHRRLCDEDRGKADNKW